MDIHPDDGVQKYVVVGWGIAKPRSMFPGYL